MHDLTAARILGILCHLAASGLIALGDKGYAGAGDPVIPPYQAAARFHRVCTFG